MFDTINGIPLHPLVVHGVVVLLPLTVLGTVAIALRPAWRAKYGLLVVGIAAVAAVLVPVATQSGKEFKKHVGPPGKHEQLGNQLIWFALALLVIVVALVVLDRRSTAAGSGSAGSGAQVVNVVAALSILAALATGYQVYRVGDSGARSAWCTGIGGFDCKPVE